MYCILTFVPSLVFFIVGLISFLSTLDQDFYRNPTDDNISSQKKTNRGIDITILVVSIIFLVVIPIISFLCYLCTAPLQKFKLSKQLQSICWYVVGLIFLVIFSIFSLSSINNYDEGLVMWYIMHQLLQPLLLVPMIVLVFCYIPRRCCLIPVNICLLRDIRVHSDIINGFVVSSCVSMYLMSYIVYNNSSYYDTPVYNITTQEFMVYSEFPFYVSIFIFLLDLIERFVLFLNLCFHSGIKNFVIRRFTKKIKEVHIISSLIGDLLPTGLLFVVLGTGSVLKVLLPLFMIPYCFFYASRMICITLDYRVEEEYLLNYMTLDAFLMWIGFLFILLLIKGMTDLGRIMKIIRKGWRKGVGVSIKEGRKYFEKKEGEKDEEDEEDENYYGRKREEIEEEEEEEEEVSKRSPGVQSEVVDENAPLIVDRD